MSLAEISGHLLADWVPSLPTSIASSFVGWPPHLMEVIEVDRADHWALHRRARGTERQWKGVLSWMLGVVGARQVLQEEGYRWIAPLSAFYTGKSFVDLTLWNPDFPPSRLKADKPQGSSVRLRPDYVAIRQNGDSGALDWAVVEAKGTANSLSGSVDCPSDWRKQVRNIAVEYDGQPLAIARHLVVATRSNPNAQRKTARCIQVRAWNSDDQGAVRAPSFAAVEIAAAHLFGLCRNLGLRQNAQAIALAVEARSTADNTLGARARSARIRDVADSANGELEERVVRDDTASPAPARPRVQVPSEFGAFQVELDPAMLRLVTALGTAESPEEAEGALAATDRALDARVGTERYRDRTSAGFNDGVRVRVPEAVERMIREREG